MAFDTHGEIEIAAPPERIFPWIAERERIAKWSGGDLGLFPSDASELRIGYTAKSQFQGPDGMRDIELEITACDPPRALDYRQTYEGGHSIGSYRLTPTGTGTRLEMSASTDYAASAGIPAEAQRQIDEQLARLPAAVQAFSRAQLETAERLIERPPEYGFVGKAMQKQVDEGLAKLKQLIEEEG